MNNKDLVINARILWLAIDTQISFLDFCKLVENSHLIQNIDYRYTLSCDTMLISINAMQIIIQRFQRSKSFTQS